MWIFFALASQFSNAMETAVDKIAIVDNKTIDSLCATFLRIAMYLLLFGLLGVSGIVGKMRIFLPWPIVVLGFFCAGVALFYTYFLKHIEATAASIVSYAAPFLYLIIDSFIVKAHLTPIQAFGIILMTAGGLMFVIEPKKLHIKKEITPAVWCMLAYNFTVGAAEYYGFKYYFSHYHINEVTYGFSVWLVSLAVLFLAVLFSAKGKMLLSTIRRRPEFLGAITLSKSFDAAQWWLYLHSLSLAAVSQVSATSELYPLMLIVIIYIAQNLFKLKAEEKFSRGHLAFKLAAVVLLILGGYFIR